MRRPDLGVVLAALLVVLVVLAGCERAKTKLDREVDRLCAIDGGIHIYETVLLSKENFGPDGEVFPQFQGRQGSEGRYGPEYQSVLSKVDLIAGDPSLARTEWRLFRQSDKKMLAQVIFYSRGGGDLPGPWAPSGHTCPTPSAELNIERRVFVKSEN